MRSLCTIPRFQAAIHGHFSALRFVLTPVPASRLSRVSCVSGAALAPAPEMRRSGQKRSGGVDGCRIGQVCLEDHDQDAP
jgi:hypothetical protein